MRRLPRLALLVAIGAASVMLGCQPPTPPLRIVGSPWPGYEPLYLARDLGYLDTSVARLSELPSFNITFEAFSNGSADIAPLTLNAALSLLAQGKKLRILAVLDVSNGADAVMAHPSIASIAGLRGKRIAISNSPLGAYMLSRVLEAARLKPSDVTVVSLPEDKHEQAYRKGRIDAAITFDPAKSRLAALGAHTIFDSSSLPNEIVDVLAVHESLYQTRRADVCHLVNQWFRALDYVATNPQDAQPRMAKRMGMSLASYRAMQAELALPTRAQNQALLYADAPALLPTARRLADIMLKSGQLAAPVDPTPAFPAGAQNCLRL